MYCLFCGILFDKIKYICMVKLEMESIVKLVNIFIKMVVLSIILCFLMCCYVELNVIIGWVLWVWGWVYFFGL